MKYSAQREGQKSSVCYSMDMWMIKNDEGSLNVCQFPNGFMAIQEKGYVKLKLLNKTQH